MLPKPVRHGAGQAFFYALFFLFRVAPQLVRILSSIVGERAVETVPALSRDLPYIENSFLHVRFGPLLSQSLSNIATIGVSNVRPKFR
jgi:hypothetical protein